MAIRSHYTGTKSREPRQSRDRSVPKSLGTKITTKAKNAIKAFSQYVEKNQRDYRESTGDRSSLSDDLAIIPIRVVYETSKSGREEEARIQRMKHRDTDEEICRFMSGRGHKKEQSQQSHPRLAMSPKKQKPKPKMRYLDLDRNAEVE